MSKLHEKSFFVKKEVLSMKYDIWIGGNKLDLDRKQCITSLSLKETDSGSSSAVINVLDPDLVFINDNIYIEDKKIKIKMWWEGHSYKHTFDGYIVAVDIDFPESGVPSLTINCMDATYKMNTKKKNKVYKKKTSAQVVQAICKSYGYKCIVESGYKFPKQDSISQSSQTDIEFITKLAGEEVHPFTARLNGNTFHYVKKGKLEKEDMMNLKYRVFPFDIISFSPRINTIEKEISKGKTDTKKKSASKSETTGTGKNTSLDSSKGDKSTGKNSKNSYTYNNDGTWTHNKK